MEMSLFYITLNIHPYAVPSLYAVRQGDDTLFGVVFRNTLLKPTFLPHRILQLPLVVFVYTDVFYLEIGNEASLGLHNC